MATVGELVAKLFCDSKNFDNNIKKSQKEVQEFKRKTEREAAAINNSFNSIGSAAGRVAPQLGNVISAFGKIAAPAAAAGAAFKAFTEVAKHNEAMMDSWEKKITQATVVLDSFWTSLSQSNGFAIFNNNLSHTIEMAGDLADALDSIGTLNGFSGLTSSKVDAAIAKFKEVNKDPNATKEQKIKAENDAKAAIEENYKVNQAKITEYQKAYRSQMGLMIDRTTEGTRISRKTARGIISDYATNISKYNEVNSIAGLLKGKSAKELLYSDYFKRVVKKFGLDFKGLFDPAMFKTSKRYLEEYRDFFVHLAELTESGNLAQVQSFLKEENLIKVGNSMQKTAYLKQVSLIKEGEYVEGSGKAGRSVYASKQEAPKERTLQDMLDDLDKSLVWNKYLAQNLGEDVTGLNLSSLEKTANELKDLLKNTTDEEQRKQIISVLKTIYNNTTKAKEIKKPVNSANFEGIYGNEIGNLSLNDKSAEYKRFKEKIDKEIENELKKNVPESFIQGGMKGVNIQEAISAETAKEFKYDADRFLKDKYIGEPSDIIKRTVQSIFDAFKLNDFGMNASLDGALNATDLNYDPLNNKIKSFIPFGNLSKLDIPIKYPEIFYSSSLASSKFSSGVSAIVKKFTGFDSFNRDFAKSAYSKFDKLIEEGNIITPDDVNKILYKVYLDTIKKHSDNTPDFFKDDTNFYKFIKDRTDIKFDPNDKEANSKVNLILGEKNKNELIYQELLNNIGSAKIAKAGLKNDLTNLNTNFRTISNINFGSDYIIGFINELSKGNIYEKAEILKNIKNALVERRKILTEYMLNFDTGEDRVKLENRYKNIRLIQLEKEKRSNKGVLSDDKQKEYEELIKELGNNYSESTDTQLDTYAEQSTREAEKLAKLIEENNKIRKDLEDKTNETDDIGNRIQREEEENNVLRERQKTLNELSNKYMSVADSAYQIGAAFSTLDSKFGDIAGVLLNVVGITAEAIGKLIGMATAQGVSNAFKLPWPQNLAAVATVIAAGASAAGQIAGLSSRKYATGGIVSGPGTSISDSIPIRVSNGEMILNHRQQGNLFNLLDKGGSKSKLSSGEVEFRISGSSLVGVLRNYNNVNNKVR